VWAEALWHALQITTGVEEYVGELPEKALSFPWNQLYFAAVGALTVGATVNLT